MAHTIGAAGDIRILLDMLKKTSEWTLAPRKHPLDNDKAHSETNMFDAI